MEQESVEAHSWLQRKTQDVLGLRPGEVFKSAVFFAYLALASSIYITGKTTRDTLFLSRYELDMLPWMFIGYGIVSPIVAFLYGRVADRFRRDRLIMTTSAIGAVTYVGVWWAASSKWSWIYPVFYIWAEVVGGLFLTQPGTGRLPGPAGGTLGGGQQRDGGPLPTPPRRQREAGQIKAER